MKTEHLGSVLSAEALDVLVIFADLRARRDDVSAVEGEVGVEHLVAEPLLAHRVQKAAVVVVCDATAVLDLAEHVPDARPVHALIQSIEQPLSETVDFLSG